MRDFGPALRRLTSLQGVGNTNFEILRIYLTVKWPAAQSNFEESVRCARALDDNLHITTIPGVWFRMYRLRRGHKLSIRAFNIASGS